MPDEICSPLARREKLLNDLLDDQNEVNKLHNEAKDILKEKEMLVCKTRMLEEKWAANVARISEKRSDMEEKQTALMRCVTSKFLSFYIFIRIYT